MRGKALFILILFLGFNINSIYGQWDAQISQYWRIKNFYNPSFVAETNNIENVMLHRQQWVGLKDAPTTSLASFNMPFDFLGKKHGAAFLMVNDKFGAFSNTTTTLQYAYQFKFKKGKYLNVGLQGSMINIGFDAGKIRKIDKPGFNTPDDAIPTGDAGKTIDAGIGLSWITPKYYLAFSSLHLWDPQFEFDSEHTSYIARSYYLSGGYNIKLEGTLIELQPSALVKYDGVAPLAIDATAKMEYNKMFMGGFSWRKGDAFVILLGAKFKNIEAGYSYDISTSEISVVGNGSHELFLRYIIPLKKKKALSGQKSVRIL